MHFLLWRIVVVSGPRDANNVTKAQRTRLFESCSGAVAAAAQEELAEEVI